mmetsp:Transcript_91763/g.259788  ORF Transcript_91763/g.259788 Transcript_91763/m.259788 type:complete len:373 (+) Transcript_91763:79-1197(+)
MCTPRAVVTRSLSSWTSKLRMSSSKAGSPRVPRMTQPRSPASCPGCSAVWHSECLRASCGNCRGSAASACFSCSSSRSACASGRVTGPFWRRCACASTLHFKSRCFSRMCRARAFSAPSRFPRFAAGSAAPAWTSRTPTMQLAKRSVPQVPSSAPRAAASAATSSEAALGCRAKARMRLKTSSSPRTAAPLFSRARWCAPSCSSWTMSTCGCARSTGRGSLRSRSPRARVGLTGTRAAAAPSSFIGGAAKASNASSMSHTARSCSGVANAPSARMPSFCNCSRSSSARRRKSSTAASSPRPNSLAPSARDTTGPVDPAMCSRWNMAEAASESRSHSSSTEAAAASTFAKASFARAFTSSGTLSGCTRSASFL